MFMGFEGAKLKGRPGQPTSLATPLGFTFVRGDLTCWKFEKFHWFHSVSYFNLGGLELRLRGLTPPNSTWQWDCCRARVYTAEQESTWERKVLLGSRVLVQSAWWPIPSCATVGTAVLN